MLASGRAYARLMSRTIRPAPENLDPFVVARRADVCSILRLRVEDPYTNITFLLPLDLLKRS